MPASARQEWVRKSDLVGTTCAVFAVLAVTSVCGFLLALRAPPSLFVLALLAIYFLAGSLERWADNRVWRRLTAAR